MRELNELSLKEQLLHAGLLAQTGMLHRSKYSRFRNDSVTSLDDGSQNNPTTLNSKAPFSASSSSSSSSFPSSMTDSPAEETSPTFSDEGSNAFCAFIPKMANIKLSNPAGLLGLKGFALPSKEVPRLKLADSDASSRTPANSGINLTRCPFDSPRHQQDIFGSTDLRGPRGSSRWNVCPPTSELAPLNQAVESVVEQSSLDSLETGMTYYVKYVGCLEVLQSMRMLDFSTRTQVTREAISRLCDAQPSLKGGTKCRKPPSKGLSAVLGKSNLEFAGMNIKLIVSTNSLCLTTLDSQQIIAHHHMQSISFASGGDPDTTDYIAYVAKDAVNHRACHILECPSALAQEVINTIGQAFELCFRQFLNNPSSMVPPKESRASDTRIAVWTAENREIHEYYNEIPGKQPPLGGIHDMRKKEDSVVFKVPNANLCEHLLPLMPNPHHNMYENSSVPPESTETAFRDLSGSDTMLTILQHINEELKNEVWYHGKLSRKDAESLLSENGDFLVRESINSPGQYVLSGLEGGSVRHLLLVDPEGMVRTKDHIFQSVGHLIHFHMDNQQPIISSGSKLCLKQPVKQKL
ncbi:SHC-transforming protein 1-like isoform X1 [Polypterus senegalus]|uniref:SHC-transforming protein 1-like isoform X1 n=1 Tax=Polypterus senegalus TaxID=55291 RepID=UPI0019650211|nr:SHC-transforming protein 1-like isoform X1 [Polypterus senegalus]